MIASLLPAKNERPSERDVLLARESVQLVRGCVADAESHITLLVNGRTFVLPDSLKSVLQMSLELVAENHAVTLLPADDEIGTQEAADLLKVSRPYLVKLLDSGAIDSRKVGVQRRVRVTDVMSYKAREKASRRNVLTELAAEGQRLNLGE